MSWTFQKSELSAARAREKERKRGENRLMWMGCGIKGGGRRSKVDSETGHGILYPSRFVNDVRLCANHRDGHLGGHPSVSSR